MLIDLSYVDLCQIDPSYVDLCHIDPRYIELCHIYPSYVKLILCELYLRLQDYYQYKEYVYHTCINSTTVIILYKHIVGYLRLGCMARERGQIYEASDWFKEALQINQVTKYTITRLASACYSKQLLISGQNCVVQNKISIC